jgi:hypothetical protein
MTEKAKGEKKFEGSVDTPRKQVPSPEQVARGRAACSGRDDRFLVVLIDSCQARRSKKERAGLSLVGWMGAEHIGRRRKRQVPLLAGGNFASM